MIDLNFTFTAELWRHSGAAAWYFLSLPKEISEQIKFFRSERVGFGTLRIKSTIGRTTWKTSLFPDKRSNSFLLPIKADVRKRESITHGDQVKVEISVDL